MNGSLHSFHPSLDLEQARWLIRIGFLAGVTEPHLDGMIAAGQRVVTTCPDAVEREPGIWRCPGHVVAQEVM